MSCSSAQHYGRAHRQVYQSVCLEEGRSGRGRSLRSIPRSSMRTNLTCAHAAIADAASFCSCGRPTAAPQRRSPNRTFSSANMVQTETAHSPRPGKISEVRDFPAIHYFDFADAALLRAYSMSEAGLQLTSLMRSFNKLLYVNSIPHLCYTAPKLSRLGRSTILLRLPVEGTVSVSTNLSRAKQVRLARDHWTLHSFN